MSRRDRREIRERSPIPMQQTVRGGHRKYRIITGSNRSRIEADKAECKNQADCRCIPTVLQERSQKHEWLACQMRFYRDGIVVLERLLIAPADRLCMLVFRSQGIMPRARILVIDTWRLSQSLISVERFWPR